MVAPVAPVSSPDAALQHAATQILVLTQMLGNAEAVVTRLVQCHVNGDNAGLASMLAKLQCRVERIHQERAQEEAPYHFQAAPVAAPLQ